MSEHESKLGEPGTPLNDYEMSKLDHPFDIICQRAAAEIRALRAKNHESCCETVATVKELGDHKLELWKATEKLESVSESMRHKSWQLKRGILSDNGASVKDETIEAMNAAIDAIDKMVKLIREPEAQTRC